MVFITQKFGYVAAVGALALTFLASSPALAIQTAAFDLTGVNTLAVLDGVYTSPYYGKVNGGAVVPVICDDFGDNSFIPEDWNAYVTSLSGISPSGDDPILKWKGAESDSSVPQLSTYNLSQVQAYTVAAYLDLKIINAPSATIQEQFSYALWELFDPTVAAGVYEKNWGSPCTVAVTGCTSDAVQPWLIAHGNDTTTLGAATLDLNNAITAVLATDVNGIPTIMNGYNVTIYSYSTVLNPNGPTGCGGCSPPPQEFITVTAVPEASSLAVFAVYCLFGGASLLFFGRRHIFQNR